MSMNVLPHCHHSPLAFELSNMQVELLKVLTMNNCEPPVRAIQHYFQPIAFLKPKQETVYQYFEREIKENGYKSTDESSKYGSNQSITHFL